VKGEFDTLAYILNNKLNNKIQQISPIGGKAITGSMNSHEFSAMSDIHIFKLYEATTRKARPFNFCSDFGTASGLRFVGRTDGRAGGRHVCNIGRTNSGHLKSGVRQVDRKIPTGKLSTDGPRMTYPTPSSPPPSPGVASRRIPWLAPFLRIPIYPN